MPDRLNNSALSDLRHTLDRAFADSFSSPDWGAPAAMTKALVEVKKRFDPTHVSLNERSIARTLLSFRGTGRLPTFIDLKYASFGLAQQVGEDKWCLIEDSKLFRALLKQVGDQKDQPRRLRKCFQGLMHSYFDYPIFDQPSEAGLANWKLLRKFLAETLGEISSARNNPQWLKTLSRHENLLTGKACERYAPALLKGNAKELVDASEGIGLSANSWVWQEATTAQTQALIQLEDSPFKVHLSNLLNLLDGKGDVQLSDSVVIRCLAQVLIRYAKCNERPENPVLRDMAITFIGNPWLKRPAWDAFVKNDNARKMVDSWLKRRLITDFFALLSEDGSADQRRLNYWLRFEPVIEDMWFVLGSHARYASSSEFREMRKRMEGRLHYLDEQGTPNNNAFMMRIGPFMVVEFGVTGNACYIFNAGDLAVDPDLRSIRLSRLKGKQHVGRLIHRGNWEYDCDAWLCPRLGWKPGQSAKSTISAPRQASAPQADSASFTMAKFSAFISRHGLSQIDSRDKGGALWVNAPRSDDVVSPQLKKWGFKYNTQKQWWWKE
jgi:hypothetical protein